ncbi:MAG: hypothetical protein GF331_27180, partial [Chitinivibrionales bacterium]|nr:hypothetical protein [Chitinivibrionales bacterium]
MAQDTLNTHSAVRTRQAAMHGLADALMRIMVAVTALMCLSARAETFAVRNMAELRASLDRAEPGDRVVLLGGTYDGALDIDCRGTEQHPIYIQSATTGTAVFSSRVRLRAPHTVVSGLRFVDSGHVLIQAPHVRVSRCSFHDCKPRTWVRIEP